MTMANKDELKRKREADQRAALLGLAADRKTEKPGSCLSSQEMAELLDGKCEAEQLQSFLAHLSSCDSCYREWLELDLELSRNKSALHTPLLFQRKFLTVSGSLLAAAASVVFYLNLDQAPGPQKVSAPAPLQLEMMQSPDAARSPVRQKRMEKVVPSAPLKKARPQATLEMRSESVQISEDSAAMPSMAVSGNIAQDSVQQWLNQVEEKCSEPAEEGVAWKVLARQGGKLVLAVESPKLRLIVEQLDHLAQGQEQERACAEIQRILRERSHDY